MTHAALPYFPMAFAWVALIYKLPAILRRRHDPGQRAFGFGLLSIALAMTALVPPIYGALDHLTGVANLARLLANGVGLVAAWMAYAFLAFLNYPEERARTLTRRAGLLLLITLGLMASLFILAPIRSEASDFWRQYSNAPFMPEYRFAFLAYLGGVLANVAYLSWRNGGIVDRPALLLGLRLTTVGCVFGLAYVLEEMVLLVTLHLGLGNSSPNTNTIAQFLVAGAAGCTLVGATMPAWGPRVGVSALYEWAYRYRSYRRLYPLWAVLYRAVPGIALLPSRSALWDTLTFRDLEFRLYRRVVEIRDGLLALRPHVDPAVTAHATELCRGAGLSPEETEAVVEAADLAAALEAKRQGRKVNVGRWSFRTSGGADVRSEVAALERVARCYARSPIVRAALVEMARQGAA